MHVFDFAMCVSYTLYMHHDFVDNDEAKLQMDAAGVTSSNMKVFSKVHSQPEPC